MATYVNDLRLKEIATGDESGTWGTSTNTNLELIGEALGYGTQQVFGSDADATTTIADGASDPARAMYFKITSGVSLTATRTCTIAPNTVSRVMFIENATTGSQSIAISQGSGANVTIATGRTAVVYLDGAGSGAAVVDALALVDPGVTDTLAEVLVAGNTSGGTNIELTTTDKVQFRDTAIYINSSADGQLDIVADTEVQIATTTVDLNGILDVSGNTTLGADVTFTGASYNAVWDSSDSALEFADNAKAVFGAGDDLQIYHDASDSIINDNGTGSLKLQQGGSTKLEVTATGVDITGTLVSDGLTVESSSDPTSITLRHTGNTSGLVIKNFSGAESQLVNVDNGPMVFKTNDTEAMRIDASGNVGFGVTPASDWNTSYRALQLANTATFMGTISGDGSWISNNAIFSSSGDWEYIQTAATSSLDMQSGTAPFRFRYAASGTAGTAISWSEAMRIDSSGNLLVGKSATSFGTDGFQANADGQIWATNASASVTAFNRRTTDGAISVFYKDGTTVGSIGTVSTALYIANDDTGLQLYGGGATDQIVPCDGSGVTRNNTIDLGKPTGRFKDLFIGNDIGHLDAAGNARLLYDKSANLLGNAGTNGTFATLSKSSGSFKIDHPLPEKTETHYLVHSFVESPQANNIYRGKVDLVDGLAAVNIDNAAGMTEGTYVLLNTNTQCFTSNESGWTAVKGSVSGNILTITAQDNTCTDTISWMVIGERHDQHMLDTEWTDENGKVIVEPLKES